jgi:cytochrome oxidase assembly protein ShyY1
MYRFLARPRWLAFHVLVLVLIVVMVNLGFWQLRRLDERRDRNARVEDRSELPAVPVDEILPVDGGDPNAVEWRSVTASGRYDGAHEVLIRNRSFDGAPGFHVVTPLVSAGGTLLVNRGWIPLGGDAGPTVPPTPGGEVSITGRIRPTQERGRVGPTDPSEGSLTELARVDVERIQAQTPGNLYPAYVELIDATPAPEELPRLLPLPELGNGPHLSYAGQWFLFSACAVAGWVVVVRRAARQGGRFRREPRPEPAADDMPVG